MSRLQVLLPEGNRNHDNQVPPDRLHAGATIGNACGVASHGQLMDIRLSELETRVLACLIEKQITTPDQCPLSLNSIVAACNQKSNRDPLLALSEREVQLTLDALIRRHFAIERSGFGSRVPKYQHRFWNTEYGSLKLTDQEVAVMCELMLRGPQTPGELRTRASRLAPLAEVTDVEQALRNLGARVDGPFVVRLPREPGRRDCRYADRFGAYASEVSIEEGDATTAPRPQQISRASEMEARLEALEARVAALEAQAAAAPNR